MAKVTGNSKGFCINTLSKIWENEFINPLEENIEVLIEKIRWFHERLTERPFYRAGRRDINPWFKYNDELKYTVVNERRREFEEAAALSLEAFEGCIRWHDPDALFNITPSPLLDSVAITTLTALYNPNAIWDITCGKFILIERKVIRYLSQLANWAHTSSGLFTFGGKATLFYAIKAGLNRCDKDIAKKGLRHDYVLIASDSCHFSLESLCNYAGIGQENCLRVKTTKDGIIDIEALARTIDMQIRQGKKIACIVASGGGTMNLCIDPVDSISQVIREVVETHKLDYQPYIHFDIVISWAWLFFDPSDDLKHLDVSDFIKQRLRRTAQAVHQVSQADSFGVDFHKTGLAPYASSCVIFKDGLDLYTLNGSNQTHDELEDYFGDARNFDYTLENSRPCSGIAAAYHNLERLGRQGFQEYLIYSVSVCERFREVVRCHFSTRFEVVNSETLGFEVVVKIHFFGDIRPYHNICLAPDKDREQYRSICDEFFEFVNFGEVCNARHTPLIGYVPKYQHGSKPGGYPAFLLYPVSPHFRDETVSSILQRLHETVTLFEDARVRGKFKSRKLALSSKEPPK